MTNRAKSFIIFLLLLLQAAWVYSAEIRSTTIQTKNGSFIEGLLIRGVIEPGDAKKFAAAIIANAESEVFLNSPGGDVKEAMLIASIVKELAMNSSVRREMTCASACFFIYLAGLDRIAQGVEDDGSLRQPAYGGRVGLHRPYLADPQFTSESMANQRKAMQIVTNYLEQNSVPRRLIEKMMSHASNDIYWMTYRDIEELGIMPPEYEEIAVKKCGYEARLFKNATKNDSKSDERLRVQLECSARLSKMLGIQGVKKLKNGWFPTF